MNCHTVAVAGEALVRKDYCLRARYMGQNLAYAVNHPEIDWTKKFLGKTEEEEACPGCHHSLMIAKPGRDYVECAICGRIGKVNMDDGTMQFDFPEDEGDRLTVFGKFHHIREIIHHEQDLFNPIKDTIAEEYEYYKKLDFSVKPPKKAK